MELEGLKRGLGLLHEHGCLVGDLVTDRHTQVKKHMREDHHDINHYFDVWHFAKGMQNYSISINTNVLKLRVLIYLQGL